MENEAEVRVAVLTLIAAHKCLAARYRAAYKTLQALAPKTPDPVALWHGVANAEQVESERTEQEAAEIEAALNSSQQFAGLLLGYARCG